MPIYSIDKTNIETVLPQLQIDTDVKSEIQNAVNAGKTVTIPESDIVFNDRAVSGYIILDPETGEGAYMISGGLNGAMVGIDALKKLLLSLLIDSAEAAEPYKSTYSSITATGCEYFHRDIYEKCLVEKFSEFFARLLIGALVIASALKKGGFWGWSFSVVLSIGMIAVTIKIKHDCYKDSISCD